MKVFVVLCLVASALALPRETLNPGLAFVEQLRSQSGSRIIQGQPASPGQFPHQAFLFTSDNSGNRYVCGGSLISPSWVVTAGHCLYGLTQAEVRLGSINYNSAPVVITTRNVNVHPNYNPNNLNNDIALIGLGQNVPLSSNVQPIRIASGTDDNFQGREATVSGFGLTSDGGSVSQTLNWVNLNIIPNIECEKTYGSQVIIASTVCGVGIQSGSQGSCNGDSGGPLIIGDQLVGIVSFGSSAGCSANVPSGFTRPNFFASWIQSVSGVTI